MHIINLASGSKANSTFVSFNDNKILIDIGLTEKKLKEQLSKIGESIDNIQAVVITHEHIDHVRALKSLAKNTNILFYVHKDLDGCEALADIVFKEGSLRFFENMKFNIGDFEIEPVEISHDAIRPVAFIINVFKSKTRVGFITDIGIVSDSIKNAFKGSKIVFIESNYDEKMIDGGPYPYVVKQRIKGSKGHLSNDQSLDFAKYLYENGTKAFVLSHISQNNNTYEKAYVNYASYFENIGLTIGRDIILKVSFQDKIGNKFLIKEDYDGI